jgi:hypothetical protein
MSRRALKLFLCPFFFSMFVDSSFNGVTIRDVHPDTLELVEDDHLVKNAERCVPIADCLREIWRNLPPEVVSALRVGSALTGDLIPQELGSSRPSSLGDVHNNSLDTSAASNCSQAGDTESGQVVGDIKRRLEPLEMLSDRIASSTIGAVVTGAGNPEAEGPRSGSATSRRRSSVRPYSTRPRK